jgi:hypothetical protein
MKKIFAFVVVLLVPAFAYAGGGDEVIETETGGWEVVGEIGACPEVGDAGSNAEDLRDALESCREEKDEVSQGAHEDNVGDAAEGDGISRKAVINIIRVRIEKLEDKLLKRIKKNERDIINLKNRVKALEEENGGACTETCKELRKELSQKYETLYQLVKANRSLIDELTDQQKSDHKLLVLLEKKVMNLEGEVASNTERSKKALQDAGLARGAAEEALEIAKELEGMMGLAVRSDWKFLLGMRGNLRKPVLDGGDVIRDGNAFALSGGVMLRRLCKPSAGCHSTNFGGRVNLQLDDFQRGANIGGEVFVEHMFGDSQLSFGPHLGGTVTGYNLKSSGHHELYGPGILLSIALSHELADSDVALRGELGVKFQRLGTKYPDGSYLTVTSTNPHIWVGITF